MRVVYGKQVLPEVESLFNDTAKGTTLRLVTGYFKPDERLGKCLVEALKRGVQATLIVRGGRSEKKHAEAAAAFPGLKVHYLPWLHAKLYISETQGIATSMNLTENSAENSGELAVCVRSGENKVGYQQMCDAFKHFLDASRLYEIDREKAPLETSVVVTPALAAPEPPIEKKPSTAGHCIRCNEGLKLNPDKPLCRPCYDEWAGYENPAYKEKYCHQCGKESRTSLAKPVCKACYAA